MSALPQAPQVGTAMLREQTMALVSLRWAVWRRRLTSDGKWGRILFGVFSIVGALVISGMGVAGVAVLGLQIEKLPETLADLGGSTAMFGQVLALMLGARLYLSIISVATGVPFLHPRRFLVYAVPPALVTAINCIAQLFEPAWIVFYAPAATLAFVVSKTPGGSPIWAGLFALFLLFICAAAVLQGVIAAVGELFAHKRWRRLVLMVFLASGWGISISLSRLSQAHSALSPAHLWRVIRYLPPGWAALLAESLGHHAFGDALGLSLLLLAAALVAALLGHTLSLREARRPPETNVAGEADRSGPAGWSIPFVPGPISALVEKEVKTIFRAMWLQMIAGPVGFLVMRFLLMQGHQEHGKTDGPFLGPQPLLMGAFYAHLGVLAWSVNTFGVDGQATRGMFLWPLRGRTVLLAKNAVAYAVSLLIFSLLACLSAVVAPLTASQVLVGFCAHAATFPVLAALGNATSIYFPSPMRRGRMQSRPGGTTAFARIAALALMALTAWAPYALATFLGLPVVAAYLGELLAMSIVYGGLLSLCEHLLESRREPLLHALSKEE